MEAQVVASLLLAAAALITAVGTLLNSRRQSKENAEARRSQAPLDEQTKQKIAADAAKINSSERIETERWWHEQFEAVKQQNREVVLELEKERRWRRVVTLYIRRHQPWDEEAQRELMRCNINIGPPPTIDLDALEVDNGDGPLRTGLG